MTISRTAGAIYCVMLPSIRHVLAVAAIGLLLAMNISAAQSKDVKVGDLVFEAPWSRATPGGAKLGVGYLAIVNIGNRPDILKSASSPIAERIEIHATSMQGGVMRMRKIEDGLKIKAQEVTELKPGGLHLMLIGLKKPIVKEQTFPVQLFFANAGKVDLTFTAAGIGATRPPAALGIGEAGGSHSGSRAQKRSSN